MPLGGRDMGTGMKRVLCAAIAAAASFGVAHAATQTFTYNFTASAFTGDLPAPTDPVTGSITLAFDPLADTTGGAINAITLVIDGHTYTPAEVAFDHLAAGDILRVGGLVNGENGHGPGTTDFGFELDNASTAPALEGFVYDSPSTTVTEWGAGAGSFTLVTVPEPATWGLMIAAFGGLGFAARRRKAFA